MFLSGLMWNVWILKGNYSLSMLFDIVLLIDLLIIVESLVIGYFFEMIMFIGVFIIVLFYVVVVSKVFCSWVCLMNIVIDVVVWFRCKFGIC